MLTLINEETSNSTRSYNPLGSYLDANNRSQAAFEAHKALFDSDEHVDRVAKVADIITAFFGHPPHYFTYRGLGTRRPFESIKVANVGYILGRMRAEKKNAELYGPLLAMDGVQVISKNGHLTVRVY